jgi:hypothetical protein
MKTETTPLACTHCGRVGMGQGAWDAERYRCTHANLASRYPAASERELTALWNDNSLVMAAFHLICPLTEDTDAVTMDALQVLREARARVYRGVAL